MLDKTKKMVMLLDFYGQLLTKKQGHALNLYYELDLTLSEIAENMDTTRQAVFDLLKRAENSLLRYETRLGLVEKFEETHEKLERAYSLINKEEEKSEDTKEALSILKEVMDRLL